MIYFIVYYYYYCFFLVLDVEAFERLLGPCMDIMKRNFDDYEAQLHEIFGSSYSAADARS